MAQPIRFSLSEIAELRRRVLAGESVEALAREHRAGTMTVRAAVQGRRAYAGLLWEPEPVRIPDRRRLRVVATPEQLARRVPRAGQADGYVFTKPPWWRPRTLEELELE